MWRKPQPGRYGGCSDGVNQLQCRRGIVVRSFLKPIITLSWIAVLFTATLLAGAEFPHAEISNKVIHAKLYLPDVENGYYRSSRFDWSGVIASLTYNGHSFFGKWFDRYDPTINDAITGPVEEFRG